MKMNSDRSNVIEEVLKSTVPIIKMDLGRARDRAGLDPDPSTFHSKSRVIFGVNHSKSRVARIDPGYLR